MSKEKKIDMVILGLLSHEDLTGYDIKKRIDGAISFFWKGSFGNIYPSLKDLEAGKLIIKTSEAKEGREKIVYSITDEGRKTLAKWLRDDQAANELRYETLLKLFFGGAADKKTAKKNIEVFEKKIREDLETLKGYAKVLEPRKDDDHLYYYLTVTFGIDTYEAYLKWCDKAGKMLG